MVVGKARRAFKKGLSIALAAAIMATSVPQLSVTAMAQEEGMILQEENTEQTTSEVTEPDDTEAEQSQDEASEDKNSENEGIQDEDSSQDNAGDENSTGEDVKNEAGEDGTGDDETTEDDVKVPDQTEDEAEDEADSEEDADTEEDTEENGEEKKKDKPVVEQKKPKVYDDAAAGEDEAEGTLIYKWDFESASVGDHSNDGSESVEPTGTVVELGENNKAMEYDVALTGSSGWEDAFTTSYALPNAYETPVKEKLTMSFDVYFPDENSDSEASAANISDFGTMKAQIVLNEGDNWTWLASDSYPEINVNKLTASDIEGYSKVNLSVDITGNKEEDKAWDFTALTSLRAVTIKLVGATSTYSGKLYIDNVTLRDTSSKTEEPDPGPQPPVDPEPEDEEVFFEQNFDDAETLEDVVNVSGSEGLKDSEGNALASLAELEEGNRAIKFAVNLSGADGWKDIFKVQLDLPAEFDKKLDETDGKVVMSYDMYFPTESVADGFGTMTALPGLKSGAGWTWVKTKKGVDFSKSTDTKSAVEGYEIFHVDVDMKEFATWDTTENKDVDFAFSDIMPIKAVIPCLAGNTSTYQGDIYLDNVSVKAIGISDGGSEEPDPPVDPVDKNVIFRADFDDLESLDGVLTENIEDARFELAEFAAGNKAVKYTVDLPGTGTWEEIFKPEIKLPAPYTKPVKGKMTMSYDVYLPSNVTTFSSQAQAAFKCGESQAWISQDSYPAYTQADFEEDAAVTGFKKIHVAIDLDHLKNGSDDYPLDQFTPLHAVIPCFVGVSTAYKGDVYLDNIELTIEEGSGDEEDPPLEGELIYENDFNAETDESFVGANDGEPVPALAELAAGNKAIKYTVDLTGTTSWATIFKAQINLPQAYTKPISDKVVMSYDVYFPETSVTENFKTIKAQAALKVGEDGTWIDQKSWPAITADTLTDSDVDGYKKFHVEIDMNNFQTWDGSANVDYPFADITPIQTVIPCLGGDVSGYVGDVYLDNLKVWAVNETEEIPDVEGDLVLDLDVSAWKVSPGYQYTGESKLENKTVGDKKFLVAAVDFSKDADKGWSEPKFDYAHAEVVPSLKGYNAFIADVYYKPANKTAGSLGHKLFAKSPTTDKETINDDTALPAGEPVEIAGLEGYYKAEFVLEKKYEGAFQNLTFSIVGKNTDYAGDIYFDNMRFTKLTTPEIYVDSTILPNKGPGIQVVDEGRSIQTASGQKVAIAESVALVDAKAIDATKNLYAYLKAVGESDSVIFGHQNDTHHKAGSLGESFSSSDTKDVTGSIAGVVGIDTLSLTGNEASSWDTPEADRIAKVAEITKEAAGEGAIVTLSAHMPNFGLIDKRVKAYGEANGTETDGEKVGYWTVNGEKQYNFSGYTPGTTDGNIVSRIMPGQDLNYLYTDYLDMIADYAKAVEGDGITILFRPFHENTGSWFWWGAAFCDEQAYINLFRYTVDYLKETRNVHNMLYVYGPGSEAANVAEYGARYPGDAYVDMIGYDMYHQTPTQANEPGYLASVKKQNGILRDFAEKHNKLYAITETGVADKDKSGMDIALKRSGNEVPDWYMQLLDEISEDGGISYFLVWANFSENGSFYLPYVVEKKENGILYGHEMLDEFIKFYNDERSVFATDMNSGFKKVKGVVNTTQETQVSGYFTAPQSGDRLLPSEGNTGNTRIAAKISGINPGEEGLSVEFVVSSEFDEVVLKAEYNEQTAVWEASLKDSVLIGMGEAMGTISLYVKGNKISEITARFNMVEQEQNDMIPEDFEGYNGNSQQLGIAWATNKASGSEIALSLTNDPDKVFGGDYGLQMDVTLADADAWAGATKSFVADWSAGNALEFYAVPEMFGQKVVVQVTAGNQVFEIYLQQYAGYTDNAAKGYPVKVTIPFSAFIGRDNKDAKFDPAAVQSIGLWCNAIAKEGVTFPLKTTLYYDELKIVTTDKTTVDIEGTIKEGIWFKEIPDQVYTGKAIKPEVQVYDDAKLLTPKKDYAVTYKNNTKAGQADIIIKGKGNYSQTIEGHFNILPKQIEDLSITTPDYLIVNGREQKITVTVKDGNKKLGTKNDYSQIITFVPDAAAEGTKAAEDATVEKAKDAGTYNIKITMKNNYAGEVTIPCKMVDGKELLSKAKVTLPSNSLDYKDGAAVEFEDPSKIVVKLNGKVVSQKAEDGTTDNYTISYEDNREVGTAKIVIRAGENSGYVGSCSKTFSIKGMPFSARTVEITGFETKLPYTGKVIRQNVELKDKASGELLEKNMDYSITYLKNLNAGKATMTITGLKKYSGTIKKTFTIDKVNLTTEMVQQTEMTVRQNRAGVTPDVEILYEGKILVKDVDYKLTYTGNKNTTTETRKAYINIAGKGNFKGSLKKAVELIITPKSWDSGEITVEVPDMKYSKSKAKYTPNPTVYDNGKKLVKNKDYTVEYASNMKDDITEFTEDGALASTGHKAQVIITLAGPDYTVAKAEAPAAEEGTEPVDENRRTFEFRIIEKLISQAKVSIKPDKTQYFSQYGTRPGKEDLVVTYANTPVADDEYSIISYSKNDKKGKATLVIQGEGQYGGTKKVTFAIAARDMKANFADAVEEIMATMMEIFE